jgi:hypothetical protein
MYRYEHCCSNICCGYCWTDSQMYAGVCPKCGFGCVKDRQIGEF